jgi:hypothetical protein
MIAGRGGHPFYQFRSVSGCTPSSLAEILGPVDTSVLLDVLVADREYGEACSA